MSAHHALFALITLTTLALCSTASAQQPWSPVKPDISTQLTDGVFLESPLRLPFSQVSVESVPPMNSAQPSQDFEHIYNAPYSEVIAFFDGEEARKQGRDVIDSSVYPEGKGYLLRTSGSGEEGSGMFFRLAHREISRDFLIVVEPRGSQTSVTLKNVVITNISSGVMPARQGFLGVNFKNVIPFNWN